MTQAPGLTYRDPRSGKTYANAREMVDDYLRRFGADVQVSIPPLDESGYSAVKRGSATVGVNVLEDAGVILFLSRIMPVPGEGTEALFRECLELNFLDTSDASFAIDAASGMLCLRAMRRISGLDFEEFEDLLGTVAAVADRWDDALRSKHGG